jgi:hypothetical protein
MLRLAATALVAFVFAMILDLQLAGTTPISPDLYLTQFCAGCAPLIHDALKVDIDWPIALVTIPRDFETCKSNGELHCESFDDRLSAKTEAEIIKSTNTQLGSGASNLNLGISFEYREQYQEINSCSYLESKLRDPNRVREECENVEPGSDDSELVSMLTLTTVSVISFALLAGFWLLHRSFRNWRLRNTILRDKASSNLQIRKGRRRSIRPIRGDRFVPPRRDAVVRRDPSLAFGGVRFRSTSNVRNCCR